jgi:hypothetical protein
LAFKDSNQSNKTGWSQKYFPDQSHPKIPKISEKNQLVGKVQQRKKQLDSANGFHVMGSFVEVQIWKALTHGD